MNETQRLLWNFVSGIRAVVDADLDPALEHTKETAMKQLDDALNEFALGLDRLAALAVIKSAHQSLPDTTTEGR
jgi:hypothetical protein